MENEGRSSIKAIAKESILIPPSQVQTCFSNKFSVREAHSLNKFALRPDVIHKSLIRKFRRLYLDILQAEYPYIDQKKFNLYPKYRKEIDQLFEKLIDNSTNKKLPNLKSYFLNLIWPNIQNQLLPKSNRKSITREVDVNFRLIFKKFSQNRLDRIICLPEAAVLYLSSL